MTEDDIAAGLAGRLTSAALGYQIAWVNMSETLTAPFLTFQVVRAGRQNPLISSQGTISRGYAQINAVIKENSPTGDRKATQMADEIIAVFPPRTKIAIPGGSIEIGDTDLGVGFQSGTHWVQPVRVNYRAFPRN
ncbi:phage tail terminator-like protein [Thioclava sp.]|uniref:phage tail terminator-like protein n=1 Tax=Thioclava sp. TaxID=1933450 RepID=UPI00324245F5